MQRKIQLTMKLLEYRKLSTPTFSMSTSTMHEFGTPQNFQHQPLEATGHSIRLIRVRPKLSMNNQIICDVRHATTSARYQCLSYRWGCQEKTRTILMRNAPSKTEAPMPLRISQNLYDFLTIVRKKRGLCRWFWIDALCINQNNTPERSYQVAHMGHIYAHALRVMIWLGRTVSRHHRTMSLADLDSWRSFVLENEYWNRAWVTQEIVLARKVTVLINDTTMSLRKLVDLVSDGLTMDWLSSPMRVLVNTGLLLRYGESKPHLLDPIQDDIWTTKKCSIPRDRIFSILELVNEGKGITVDYESPTIDLARSILRACSGITCYCLVLPLQRALGIDASTDLSSWLGLASEITTTDTVPLPHSCKGASRSAASISGEIPTSKGSQLAASISNGYCDFPEDLSKNHQTR